MRERTRVGFPLVMALVVGASGCGSAPTVPPRPDLLLVTADSLRPDRLSCYGGPTDLGGRLCALGSSPGGAIYEWAFATAPSGAASAASLLTSLYPSQHGLLGAPEAFLPSGVESLPEVLSSTGYETAAVVSQAELNRSRNLHQGFDHYDDGPRFAPGARQPGSGIETVARLGHLSAAQTTDAALRWLAGAGSPWFLWVHYGDLHWPLDAAPIANYEEYERRYREGIRRIEHELMRLLSATDRPNRRPALLLTATHGEAIGEDGVWFSHGHSLGLEQLRVPLLWRPSRGPGPLHAAAGEARPIASEANAAGSAAVSGVDVAPTLLWAAGVAAPESWEGEPLPTRPQALPAPGPPRPVFAEQGRRVAVVADHRYYARDREPGGPARVALLVDGEELPAPMPVLSTNREETGADRLEALLAEFLGSMQLAK